MRAGLAGTPGRLRVVSAISILAALCFGLIGAAAVNQRADALADARANAAQLVRIQAVRINLVQADADATNAFLVGGLEPAQQRAEFEASIARAERDLVDAAGANAEDAAALGQVNDSLARYLGLIESARANNRQGFPVGAAYLRQASGILRTEVLPTLSRLVDVNAERVSLAYDASASAEAKLALSGGVAVVVLLGAQVWLALRTHRFLNVPIVVGTGAIVASLVIGLVTMAWAQNRADGVRKRSYAATLSVAQARISAFDAKSNESLTLVYRGSGADYEESWKTSTADAHRQLQLAEQAGIGTNAQQQLEAWQQVHVKIRELDDRGDWDGAVDLATGEGADAANPAFRAFALTSQRDIDTQASATANDLGTTDGWLNGTRWLILLAGLLAAVAVWWGFSLRLEEYR